jgi:hypothetical protein
MIIYGLMLMGLCMFAGLIVGDLLGLLLGISANIGGVGFAMLFLVVISQKLTEKGLLSKPAEQGLDSGTRCISLLLSPCPRTRTLWPRSKEARWRLLQALAQS